jgi:hypothetical protein
MTKNIEVRDLVVGPGVEVTKDSVVAANVRTFLRRGDEVSPSPLLGTRMLIDLGRREAIAGLLKGIPGMRVGGTREIVISPHLAYGTLGIPGRIPPNALLRCEVELLELREHSALLPSDWMPGQILIVTRNVDEDNLQRHWCFIVHESGNSQLNFAGAVQAKQEPRVRLSEVPILLVSEMSIELLRLARILPEQLQEECVEWGSGYIDKQRGGTVIKDSRNGVRCMIVQIVDSGKVRLIFGVHEEDTRFRNSEFYLTVERLIGPHLLSGSALS